MSHSSTFPFALCLLFLAVPGQAQQPSRPVYDRTEDCIGCHERPYRSSGRKDEFVQDLPGTIWTLEDKHRQSFILLRQNRSLVTQILGFDWDEVLVGGTQLSEDPQHRDRVARVKQCLRCHATWPKNDLAWDDARLQPPVNLELGVSCQACHGPGLRWSRAHRETAWRLCSAEAKTRLGMTDVRDPVRRAHLCASCHVGSQEEGKFVTHEMYAAGHPPLPSFEFAAFSQQMPRHWRSFSEKGAFLCRDASPPGLEESTAVLAAEGIAVTDLKANYRAANAPHVHADSAGDLYETKSTLLSGLVVMRDYLKILQAGLAEERLATRPEFALFDCTACHHELRPAFQPNERTIRLGLPGRPPLPTWPATLARAALWGVSPQGQTDVTMVAEFDRMWCMVQQAAVQRPFGNAVDIHREAGALSGWLQTQIDSLNREPFDRKRAERTWSFLTDPSRITGRDYHSARQVAWALHALGTDFDEAARVQHWLFPGGKDPLQLRLPAGQSGNVLQNLGTWSAAIADYDPQWFESVLTELGTR